MAASVILTPGPSLTIITSDPPARAPSSPVPCKVYASAARAAEAKSLHGSHFPLAQSPLPASKPDPYIIFVINSIPST